MRVLIALLWIALSAASGWAKQGDCAAQQREYERTIEAIPQTCSTPSDCTNLGILWNPCGTPRLHSKDALDKAGVSALAELRKTKQKECGWVMPPCPAVPVAGPGGASQILCLKNQCSSTEEYFAASKGVLKLRLVDAKTGKPLSGAQITVLAGHIIYCATVPCPEGRKVQTFKTDPAGVLALPRSLLQGKISIRLSGPGQTGSLEELSLASLITLSQSEIRF